MAAKRENKEKLAAWVLEKTGYTISPDALFDIQVGGGSTAVVAVHCVGDSNFLLRQASISCCGVHFGQPVCSLMHTV